MSTSSRAIAFVLGGLLLPVALLSAWLVVSRRFPNLDTRLDFGALAVSIAAGAPFAWRLANSRAAAVGLVIMYVLVAALVLAEYGMAWVGL